MFLKIGGGGFDPPTPSISGGPEMESKETNVRKNVAKDFENVT